MVFYIGMLQIVVIYLVKNLNLWPKYETLMHDNNWLALFILTRYDTDIYSSPSLSCIRDFISRRSSSGNYEDGIKLCDICCGGLS